MKKILTLSLAFILCFNFLSFGAPLNNIAVEFDAINVTVNGKPIDVSNILYNDTTYIPLRAVSEALGCSVGWDGSSSTAMINGSPNAQSSEEMMVILGIIQTLNLIQTVAYAYLAAYNYDLGVFESMIDYYHNENTKEGDYAKERIRENRRSLEYYDKYIEMAGQMLEAVSLSELPGVTDTEEFKKTSNAFNQIPELKMLNKSFNDSIDMCDFYSGTSTYTYISNKLVAYGEKAADIIAEVTVLYHDCSYDALLKCSRI